MANHLLYFSFFLCIGTLPLVSSVIDCSNYNPLICQPDLIEYCLTDGTLVQGSCEAHHQVCNESKVIDETFESCQTSQPFNCTGYVPDTEPCLPDLLEYCFTNGETVVGTCQAKSKYCIDNMEIDVSGKSCEEPSIDCENHDANEICRPDFLEFCLSDGRTIQGLCQAEKIVCSEEVLLDLTGLSCNTVDCGRYNTTQQCDDTDDTKYCFSNDRIITGECNALESMCLNGMELVTEEGACSTSSQIAQLSPLLLFIIFIIFNI